MKTISIYETGCVRRNNEDSYLILPEYDLYAVADGMGGHNAGEVASRLAVEGLKEKAKALIGIDNQHVQEWMIEAIDQTNKEIFEASFNSLETQGMGTTLTALLIKDNKAVIGHVGDSRIYLWRNSTLRLLSEDHSMVNELIRLGQLTAEKAKNHPHRNVLSRALGVEKTITVDCFQLEIQKRDVFLLCTDGFSNMLEMEEMAAEFANSGTWEDRMARLQKLVLERGAPDNFTAVCCILDGEEDGL
ncbi:MAG: Stp1/IreP family PP2C-type Ser/Thr phosphatase [Peptococcaceae bacterium]|nr:Stp1/IreP family PP2C-type Ser/Thr phosphatase [Peptococcaceae bacterium]